MHPASAHRVTRRTRISHRITLLVLFVILVSTGVGIVLNTVDNRYRTLQQTLDFAKIALFQSDSDSQQVHRQLLQYVGARTLSMKKVSEERDLGFLITAGLPPIPQKTFFLEDESIWEQFFYTITTLFEDNDTIIRIIGKGYTTRDDYIVEAFVFERPIRDAMREDILQSSLFALFLAFSVAIVIISTIYYTLTSPLSLLEKTIINYKQHPSEKKFLLVPTHRKDEIGAIHNEFSDLQRRVSETLKRQDRLAAIGSSVAKISHDLRSTIGSVSMLIDGLRGKNQDPSFVTEIETIFQTLDRAVALCSSTMSYAKQHKVDYHRSWQEVDRLLKKQHHSTNVQYSQNPDVLYLLTDPLHFHRVCINLIENASQAGASKVDISANIVNVSTLQAPLVAIATDKKENRLGDGSGSEKCLQILFTDNGAGFSQKALDNLFQPFTGSTKLEGNGLGLPISREIIDDLGGELNLIETSSGKSVFQMAFSSALFSEDSSLIE